MTPDQNTLITYFHDLAEYARKTRPMVNGQAKRLLEEHYESMAMNTNTFCQYAMDMVTDADVEFHGQKRITGAANV